LLHLAFQKIILCSNKNIFLWEWQRIYAESAWLSYFQFVVFIWFSIDNRFVVAFFWRKERSCLLVSASSLDAHNNYISVK
jgi:hypothetical protein